jgi:hypothetical protein
MSLESVTALIDEAVEDFIQHDVAYGGEHQRRMPLDVERDYLRASIREKLLVPLVWGEHYQEALITIKMLVDADRYAPGEAIACADIAAAALQGVQKG